ncbi:MAG: VRR-NUC domain-containing protein [Bdellovibrionales bacterium]|nr:VRR-NUC domain-containing protein [Bdellovibrionales bacterium]
MSEATITRKFKTYLKDLSKSHRVYSHKVSDRFSSGVPDYFVIINGYHLWIELKASGEKPRPIQNHTMARINEAGGRAVWFDDYDNLISFIESEVL